MTFGPPDDYFYNEQYFVYRWTEQHAGLFVAGPSNSGVVPIEDEHRLVMEFAPDGRLVRFRSLSAFSTESVAKKVQEWIATPGTERK